MSSSPISPAGAQNKSELPPPAPPASNNFLFFASELIINIGSLAMAGYAYRYVGLWAVTLGSPGIAMGLALFMVREHSRSNASMGADSTHGHHAKKATKKVVKQPRQTSMDSELGNLLSFKPSRRHYTLNISGDYWLSACHIQRYITFLATQYPQISYTADPSFELSTKNCIDLEDAKYRFKKFLTSEQQHRAIDFICLSVTKNHWTLIYIDHVKRSIEYYDSKANYGNYNEIMDVLKEFAHDLSQKDQTKPPYQCLSVITESIQPDSYQCGVWVLLCLENRLKNPDFDPMNLDPKQAEEIIKAYREQVKSKLIEMKNASVIRAEEKAEYLLHYKDEKQALEMWKKDWYALPPAERWKKRLEKVSLHPSCSIK